jgi:PKD repeat protein
MDYTGCANEFTANQQTRAAAALTNQRSSFLQSNGNQSLVPPAAATVDFSATSNVACLGSTISFTDNSGCTPNSYTNNGFPGITFSWTFTNNAGTTLTSNLQNPVITFNTAGTYDVTLTITNASGTRNLTKVGFIRVATAPVTACTPTSTNAGGFAQTSGAIITEATTTRTLGAGDNAIIIYCTSGSATTITCASGLGAGFSVTIIQGGADKVTVAAGGQTLVSYSSLFSTMGQYAVISLICPVANTFVAAGNLGV